MTYLLHEYVKSVPRHRSKSAVTVPRHGVCRVKRGKSNTSARICIPFLPITGTNDTSARQKIPRMLLNPKVHYRTHKGLSLFAIQRQLDPVNATLCYVLKIHFNNILPSNN